jgi:hypothetical protein
MALYQLLTDQQDKALGNMVIAGLAAGALGLWSLYCVDSHGRPKPGGPG